MSDFTATYSPDDNKLRLYAAHRLDAETFARVKAAGFRWAPRQELFVAPAWTPGREDLLLELAGEIGDEDASLIDRAEERAERFDGYSSNRAADAARAAEAVHQLADNIPLGQPILVGHHSERRARKDAEKIERGMQRAVKMWDTSKYWQDRAAGAIRHAKYKELPAVRARRIRKIEADERKQAAHVDRAERLRDAWSTLIDTPDRNDNPPSADLRRRRAVELANRDGGYFAREYARPSGYTGPLSLWDAAGGNINGMDPETAAVATVDEIRDRAIANHTATVERCGRWLAHYRNRLAYERAMLAEQGGTVADRTKPEKGGAVRCVWGPRGGWAFIQKVNKVTVTVHHSYNGEKVFRQNVPLDKLQAIMSAADVEAAREAGRLALTSDGTGFHLMQSREQFDAAEAARGTPNEPEPEPIAAEVEQMRESLRAGVSVVTAPQLFPTPDDVARQVARLAEIPIGARILEPSAGTGALLNPAVSAGMGFDCGVRVVAVEINGALVDGLRERRNRWLYSNDANFDIRQADFLECTPADLGTFDRIVMNPPFERASDIAHIQHARQFLKPGGRLVSVCAAGPRQREQLQPIAEWVDLPAGSFKVSGTGVNTALVVIEADEPGEIDGEAFRGGEAAGYLQEQQAEIQRGRR